ncbi:MAG: phage tail protein [Woeseia sp.]|nr:phage tail protein [Woeseia sp.]
MTGISVRVNQQDLANVRSLLSGIKNGAERAITRSLNRTMDKAQTRANQEIRKDVKLSATYVRGKLRKQRATFSNLSASISAESRGVLLTRYKYKELARRKGIRVWIKASGAAATMPGAFIVRNLKNSGATGIALPPGSKAPGPSGVIRAGGAAFDVLHGPSVSQVLTEVKDEIQDEMADFLSAEMSKQVDLLLGR